MGKQGEIHRAPLIPIQQTVNFIYDGARLTPLEYAAMLNQIASDDTIQPDNYSNGGIVETLEHKCAHWLGKERAVFMPTGTLANHIALRELASPHKRAIVQSESHIYNDCGDCTQTLSGLTLIPLAPNRAGFTLEEVQAVLDRASTGRVSTRVGVISIESPVRRQDDTMFGYDEMRRISAFALQEGIRLHLDGARLFIEAVHTGIAPAQYAELFDTVYISMSKCFNATSGAILAGRAEQMEPLYHVRRMFGGSLSAAWPDAAVALQFIDGFVNDYTMAWKTAQILFRHLDECPTYQVERIPNGTHIVKLHVSGAEPEQLREKLRKQNIHLPAAQPGEDTFFLKINPSLNRLSADQVIHSFIKAG